MNVSLIGAEYVRTHCREKSTPLNAAHAIFDPVHRPWGAAQKEELDVIDDEGHNLKEATSNSRQLQENVGEEEDGRSGKVGGQKSRGLPRVLREGREGGNDT